MMINSMVRHGTQPSLLDRRDFSFHKTFPHFAAAAPETLSFLEYNLDAGITMPDQMADGYPYGCTGYTQADAKTDQEKKIFDPGYTYKKTCYMEGHDPNTGCDIRVSARSLRVYGAKEGSVSDPNAIVSAADDAAAVPNKSGQSFSVDRAPGRDWFDSFRIALRSQLYEGVPSSISIGTPWFPEWAGAGVSGLLTALFIFNGDRLAYSWHNYKICGEKTIDGAPTLRVKSWQGKNIGDGGWLYMDRATFNKAFDIYGTLALITAKAKPEDVRAIDLDILQTVLDYLNRILGLISTRLQRNIHA